MIDYDFEAPAADLFERWLLRRYACGALAAETRRTRLPSVLLARWLVGNAGDLDATAPVLRPGGLDDAKARVSAEVLAELAPLIDRLQSGDESIPRASRLERRLTWLAGALRLCPLDAAILGVVVRAALARPVRELLDRLDGDDGAVGYNDETRVRYVGALLGRPLAMVSRRLRIDAPLRALGLVEDRGWGDVAPSATILALARHGSDNPASLRRLLIGSTGASDLAWTDFAHLGDARGLAERVLRDALRRQRRGVNILFYGAPGTGKTEFAKMLAARLGASAAFAGETGRNRPDVEPTRTSRIAAVALTGALAARAARTFVVVDEADDIFLGVTSGNASGRQGSKVFMHRLVEAVAAPTIWITNEPGLLGEAVVRRMSLVVRFPPPAAAVRERIIERCAARHRLALDGDDRAQLAQINAPPAILTGAIRTAQRIGGGAATVRQLVGASTRLLSGGRAPAVPAAGFDPSLSAADTDLVALTARIVAASEKALSFCFHGVPGSGKSAYARHLARKLGLEIVERRTSDLLSKWLGETEKEIRGAFEEAADRQAFLIFDEADSLLADRAGAERSWEISQVNEMLTSMEAHPYPFACTTNAFEALDPAALRRFLFKVKFLAMTPEQISEAFRRHFAQEAPAQLMRLGALTPGDFALVARKARMLAETDGMRLAGWLADEVAAKPGARLSRIGF